MRVSIKEVGGIETRFFHEGAGEVLLLVHGIGGAGDWWLRNIDALGEHFSVYAPDILGHGFTASMELDGGLPQPEMVRHLNALMDDIGAQRYSIAGHSFGGQLAALIYFDRPERIDKLILVGSTLPFKQGEEQRRSFEAASANAVTAMSNPSLESCRKRMANICYDSATVPEEILLSQLTSYALADRLSFYQQMISGLVTTADSDAYQVYKRLEKIAARTLIVVGRDDIRASWELAEKHYKRMPDADLVIFEHCGHQPMFEQPDRFNRLVEGFLGH